ncbi:DUF2071 domain-containing protein [Bacillus aerolatus]|uniref:DUF2071 domain-containing protein n=1 Tax=Bacillus aerolatus TaxID=2653354 RepID=A0A6I1FLI1_9BACI|nr:DUF2071 domain-containing protein [Bacillus aerolatus]KAB7707843.1 DUF2071 domain-containing protein [Bacillus aerolatus]
MHEAFFHLKHRPIPLPHSSWIMTQTWSNVLFMHWPVHPEALRCFLPASLTLDLYGGAAWLGIVTFKVDGMRARGLPLLPFLHSFLQLNVRTYVLHEGVPGVYFFNLDINHLPSVFGAKVLYAVPFRKAKSDFHVNKSFHFHSTYSSDERLEELDVLYRPASQPYFGQPGTFGHWAAERYCLFTERMNKLYRGDIHHTKWALQKAEASINDNTVAPFLSRKYFQQEPVLHFSKVKKAFFWPLQKVH